jgi:hypothetical protein
MSEVEEEQDNDVLQAWDEADVEWVERWKEKAKSHD